MSRVLPVSEVKARFPELVKAVQGYEEEVVVTRNGRPAAVLVGFEEFERLTETIDVLGDKAMMKQISASREFFTSGGKGLSIDEVFAEPAATKPRAWKKR